MENIWAPWRIDYILGPKPDECILCLPEDSQKDEQRLILCRAEHCFVIMNRFPYTNGHLMVAPYRHLANLVDLTPAEGHEIMDFVQHCTRIIKEVFRPDGVNIGMNIGEAAGAGIEEHIHFHVVPRWNGDCSFMAVLGDTTVIPEYLGSAYKRLKPYFEPLAIT
jgi:ATP adenylyltransferase